MELSQESREVCATRDIFQARLDTRYREMVVQKLLPVDDIALLTAVLGEIGNNCYDHNFGQWKDAMGCYFSVLLPSGSDTYFAILSDRGQGVLSSLKHVKPELVTEDEAVKIAFEQKISGRSPEQRGNGLKFVRSVINGSKNRGLLFFSGTSKISFGGMASLGAYLDENKIRQKQGTGTLAFVAWQRP